LAAIGFLYVIVTAIPWIDNTWIRMLSGAWNAPTGDILIVPSAEALRDVIGLSSYWRSVYAARDWREGHFRGMVVTGGPAEPGGVPTSQLMRDFIVCLGVPANAIRTETTSRSTRENAVNTARLLADDPSRKILVTSDYHMFRALRVFRKAGLAVEPSPLPDAAKSAEHWRSRWPAFVGLCTETVKIVYYWARGWI
jgi:uncharacterized SAM-binding protein YcdF (DUF218 family)